MTTDKAHKRAVRARMTKTGEAYTAARAQVDRKASRATTLEPGIAPSPPLPPRVAEPDVSEESVVAGTGKGWDDWFRILDAAGVADQGHTAIARWLAGSQPISGWWSQQVTVGYERARGLRAVNQRDDGFYVAVSKTIRSSPEALFESIVDEASQARWLEPGTLRRRTALPHRSARFDFRGGPTRVNVSIDIKDDARTTVTVEHARLTSTEEVEVMRAFWRERLGRLARAVM